MGKLPKKFFFMLSTSAELNIYMPIKTFNKICCLFAATQYPKKKFIYTQRWWLLCRCSTGAFPMTSWPTYPYLWFQSMKRRMLKEKKLFKLSEIKEVYAWISDWVRFFLCYKWIFCVCIMHKKNYNFKLLIFFALYSCYSLSSLGLLSAGVFTAQ